MANELQVNITGTLRNAGVDVSFTPGQIKVDQAATGYHHSVVTVGTSEEAILYGDLTTPGFCFVKNTDPTNFVELGTVGDVIFAKLKAGEVASFRIGDSVTIYATADTAACKVEFLILED